MGAGDEHPSSHPSRLGYEGWGTLASGFVKRSGVASLAEARNQKLEEDQRDDIGETGEGEDQLGMSGPDVLHDCGKEGSADGSGGSSETDGGGDGGGGEHVRGGGEEVS